MPCYCIIKVAAPAGFLPENAAGTDTFNGMLYFWTVGTAGTFLKLQLIMLNKVEHIGIAVKDLEAAIAMYEQLLGVPCYKIEAVESEGVRTAFFLKDGAKIELVASEKAGSAIAGFIEKKGEGMHHIAYDVDNIHAEMERLQAAGFTLISEQPKKGADNKLVCFLHPRSSGGVLVELCQEIQ